MKILNMHSNNELEEQRIKAALCQEASELPIYQPKESAWLEVKKNLPKPVKPHADFAAFYPLAASILFCVLLVFTTDSSQKNNNSVEVFAAEQLTMQISDSPIEQLLEEEVLWQLAQIDEQINNTTTPQKQGELLIKRNKILTKLLSMTKIESQLI